METVIIVLKSVVSFSILNVWLLRYNRPSQWRGGNSKSLLEEFHAYGLSTQLAYVVGFIKVALSVLLLISIFWEPATFFAATGIILMMAGAIAMHFKIQDPIKKSLPAILFLSLSVLILYFR